MSLGIALSSLKIVILVQQVSQKCKQGKNAQSYLQYLGLEVQAFLKMGQALQIVT
jgi:hypothetical protein